MSIPFQNKFYFFAEIYFFFQVSQYVLFLLLISAAGHRTKYVLVLTLHEISNSPEQIARWRRRRRRRRRKRVTHRRRHPFLFLWGGDQPTLSRKKVFHYYVSGLFQSELQPARRFFWSRKARDPWGNTNSIYEFPPPFLREKASVTLSKSKLSRMKYHY